MNLIDKGLKDRYITINKKNNQVSYLPQHKSRSLDNPEEKVQLATFLKLIYQYQYPPKQILVCEPVKMGSSTKEADIILVYLL